MKKMYVKFVIKFKVIKMIQLWNMVALNDWKKDSDDYVIETIIKTEIMK